MRYNFGSCETAKHYDYRIERGAVANSVKVVNQSGTVVVEVIIRNNMHFFDDVLMSITQRKDENKQLIIPGESTIYITDEAAEVISTTTNRNRKIYGNLITRKFHDLVPSPC